MAPERFLGLCRSWGSTRLATLTWSNLVMRQSKPRVRMMADAKKINTVQVNSAQLREECGRLCCKDLTELTVSLTTSGDDNGKRNHPHCRIPALPSASAIDGCGANLSRRM